MADTFLAPDPINSTQFIPGSATPANGGQLFFYLAGTSTKQTAYKDNAAATAWSNPLVLDSGGNPPSGGLIWFAQGIEYKVVFAPSTDTDPPASPYWTRDNLQGMNDVSSLTTSSEWIVGPTPTFISGTSFSLVGDQTATFTVGRRVRTTNTGGTVYGTIISSAFGAITTVTVQNDSGAIDSGLSAVAYGILNAVNPSVPSGVAAIGAYAVLGCRSQNAPNTTIIWNLEASQIITRNPISGALARFAPGTSTHPVNVSTAGPVAGGRDQAALFSSDSFPHFYWINKADLSLAGIASSSGPAIGPTLPSGYVAWAYDSTVKLSSSSLVQMFARGDVIHYAGAESNQTDNSIVFSASASSISSIISQLNLNLPSSVALCYELTGVGDVSATGSTSSLDVYLYSGQTTDATHVLQLTDILQSTGAATRSKGAFSVSLPNTTSLSWKTTAGTGHVVTVNMYVKNYTVPNGG